MGRKALQALEDRWSLGLVLAVSLLPLLHALWNGAQLYDMAHEFMAYRIGDALRLKYGDPFTSWPVQGLPTALLSKLLTNILHAIYGAPGFLRLDVLQIYGILFYVAIFGLVALGLWRLWPQLTGLERAAVAIMTLVPWFIGAPPTSQLFSVEYWVGEWAFLVVGAALLLVLPRRSSIGLRELMGLGAWIGLGVAIKITMLGIAPLLLFALPGNSTRNIVPRGLLMAVASFAAYAAIAFVYMNFSRGDLIDLLTFQFNFYLVPNESHVYPDFRNLIVTNLYAAFLFAVAAALLIARGGASRILFGLLWLALGVYLVVRRQHDTSLASAVMLAIFLIAICAGRGRTLIAALVAIAALPLFPRVVPVAIWSGRLAYTQNPKITAFLPKGMLYMPDNYWNAATPAQAFSFGAGVYPVGVGPDGLPAYLLGGKAMHALFGDRFAWTYGSPEQTKRIIEAGLKAGLPIYWTRPGDGNYRQPHTTESYKRFLAILESTGATATETPVSYRKEPWLFGTAAITGRARERRNASDRF